MRSETWMPQLNCAVAANRNEFCIALTELEYDDPFSAIISFDGRLEQPWGRTDVRREINSLCVTPLNSEQAETGFVALSNEGDVYFIGSSTMREKIAGAGILSPDASGLGAMFEIAAATGSLWRLVKTDSYTGGRIIMIGRGSGFRRSTPGMARWMSAFRRWPMPWTVKFLFLNWRAPRHAV